MLCSNVFARFPYCRRWQVVPLRLPRVCSSSSSLQRLAAMCRALIAVPLYTCLLPVKPSYNALAVCLLQLFGAVHEGARLQELVGRLEGE